MEPKMLHSGLRQQVEGLLTASKIHGGAHVNGIVDQALCSLLFWSVPVNALIAKRRTKQ